MTLDGKAREFAKLHPTHDGGTWHLWCASLMYRMCVAYGSGPIPVPASAKIAGDLAGKLNLDYTKAPVGAFHYWTWGIDGHVGLDTKGGGTDVFMASAFIRESFGNAIGFQSVDRYTRDGAYPYRGWSMNYGKNGKITQEVAVAIPVVASKPAVNPPVVTIADVRKWNGDQGIIGAAIDGKTPVTYDVLRWAIFKLEHRKA